MIQENKIYMILTIASFWIIIFTILIFTNILPKEEFSEMENRYLEKKEKLTVQTIFSGEYERNFERYLSDHVAFRNQFVMLKNECDYISGKREINGAYIGKESQYFEIVKNENRLEDNIIHLSKFIDNFKDTQFTFIPALSAFTIYKELLPKNAPVPDEDTIKDKIAFEMNVVDTITKLSEVKNEYIYYKTDHHWTQLGAYYAYGSYAEYMGLELVDINKYKQRTIESFLGSLYSRVPFFNVEEDNLNYYVSPNTSPKLIIDELSQVRNGYYYMPAADKKDKYTLFLGGNYGRIDIENKLDNVEGETLLVIKDSFAHPLIPFLSEHYNRVIVLDMRYYKESVSDIINSENVSDLVFVYNLSWFAADENIVRIK